MDLSFSAAEEAFRAELRQWLQRNVPPPLRASSLAEEVAELVEWQRRLAAARWVGVHWPREHGGRGATLIENFIFQEEMARAQAPEIINRIGVNLVGPTLIRHGSAEQQSRYLAPILRAEEIWCQLFSEPNAGSDLSALQCRAERVGDDDLVINGQKVWTSYAQFARWGILLARTDASLPKSRGISFLIVDMHSPGVTIRPLRQMTGSDEFNEVFLDNVRVPLANLVGELNGGWSIAQTTLAHERGTSARQLVVHRILLDELLELGRAPAATYGDGAACTRQQMAQAWIEVELLKLHNWRVLTHLERHGEPGHQSSLVKLFWSEMSQRLHDTAMQTLGAAAQLASGDDRAPAHGRWQRSYLYYRSATIFAGTSEIQRNIIAERVLGLPRD